MSRSRYYLRIALRCAILAAVVAAACVLAILIINDTWTSLVPILILGTVPGALLIISTVLVVVAISEHRKEDRPTRMHGYSSRSNLLNTLSSNLRLAGLYELAYLGLIGWVLLIPLSDFAGPAAGFILWPLGLIFILIYYSVPVIGLIGLIAERPNRAKLVPGVLLIAWIVVAKLQS